MTDRIVVETSRDRIRGVAAAWRRQYGDVPSLASNAAILARLDALDPETATAEDVAEIIGNRSWTSQACSCCGRDDRDVWVRLGDDPDYESTTAWVCGGCLDAARDALNQATSAR